MLIYTLRLFDDVCTVAYVYFTYDRCAEDIGHVVTTAEGEDGNESHGDEAEE